MRLKSLDIMGFKSFAKKGSFLFDQDISAIVGPNGSGKSNVAESFRFVLGEQSIKSMRGKKGEDLIFNGTGGGPRQNKATVTVTLDNADKKLPIDFDEVIISRTVHRDGANDYLINGSNVRLKDIHELLNHANIGSTGHHIISQGEADKILNASDKDRRSMLEDALGLRMFQFKKRESEKKMEKTEANITEVELKRREIAPHLRFLKKQVSQIEKAKELKIELTDFYRDYLYRESLYVEHERMTIEEQLTEPRKTLQSVDQELEKLKQAFEQAEQEHDTSEADALQSQIARINGAVSNATRTLGQLEGELRSLVRMQEQQNQRQEIADDDTMILLSEVELLKEDLEATAQPVYQSSVTVDVVQEKCSELLQKIDIFITEKKDSKGAVVETVKDFGPEITEIKNKQEMFKSDINELEKQKTEYLERVSLMQKKEDTSGQQKRIYEIMSEKNTLEGVIQQLRNRRDLLDRDEMEYKREMTEARTLIGRSVLDFSVLELSQETVLAEDRSQQEQRRRELEKKKIRLEQYGVNSGDEVIKEYEEVKERDEFLQQEVEDLQASMSTLKEVIGDLEHEIDRRFRDGISTINAKFTQYFELMFGGGGAALRITKPHKQKRSDVEIGSITNDGADVDLIDEEEEEGIEIAVNVPRKKIKGLIMLSGGERALVSIALIFAMSAVNPPPFIILDETDAALDEANSRKYGDMIVQLADHSQLILITHNRETMSRAGSLYGVTMNQGISQILSIKFDDGLQFAK